jgi:D-2-hydroxyacid dehydrogenase (NADP+)
LRRSVLAPFPSKQVFAGHAGLDFEPLFYELGRESLLQRAARKLGLRDVRRSLESRIRIDEGHHRLDGVFALWLSPEAYLSPMLMASLLDRLPALKWVYSQVKGTDHLDLGMFRQRGVMVSNCGDLNSRRVAEMVLACVCAHAKRIPLHIEMQHRRKWQSLPSYDLPQQTVGIIGTGSIGKNVAALCRAVGMHTLGASRNPERFGDNAFPFHRVVQLHGGLESLLAEADHVVLTLPLNEITRGLIGRRELGKMRRTASLINVARGAIVKETDLCDALSEGRISAAYIDRPNHLPPPIWSPLYRTPNLVLTHYSAAHHPQQLREAFEQFVRGLQQVIQTGQAPDRVA